MANKKILIIDDDEFMLSLLSLCLKGEGFDITTAQDGQEGFNKAVVENFDLIITDMKMPNWSGAESIYGLNLVDCKSKIIVVTGYMEDDLREELSNYQSVVAIINKPFDPLKLAAKVHEILD